MPNFHPNLLPKLLHPNRTITTSSSIIRLILLCLLIFTLLTTPCLADRSDTKMANTTVAYDWETPDENLTVIWDWDVSETVRVSAGHSRALSTPVGGIGIIVLGAGVVGASSLVW
ncbi:uncharacterized protein BO88DRAFT_452060 [Aspergillus vadensis CBS 113365]|uniref:Uncharacterized protein n=1 Tax=Aspergillus vadensis (strain CBS 113365 / IMI 142717 / IBT 24658) TaxID=1448311 RepID=A0A319BEI4_ASPVC|nr:hypothetical protein BO88DRAFT_452060 [Aspergillus vadensis CBS 113365]PYH70531.1 hypothetical protein BO88DRAFT_452060 [Aspergillus vadensis CBS 113365]